jgi:hypothetical protein
MIFKMMGYVYSSKKLKWKKVIEKFGLKWKGNMETFIWEGNGNKLVAYYLRVADITKDTVLFAEGSAEWMEAYSNYWKGEQVEVLEDFPSWCDVKKEGVKPTMDAELSPRERFNNWLRRERHYVENLTTKWNYYGKIAPEGFYMAACKDLEERSKLMMEELGI